MDGLRKRSQVSPITVWTIGLNVLAMLAIIGILKFAWVIVSWILVALMLALAVEAPVRFLIHRGFRRGGAVALVFVAVLGFLALVITRLVPLFIVQGRNLVHAAPHLLDQLRHHAWMEWANAQFGVLDKAQAFLSSRAGTAVAPVFAVVAQAVSTIVGGLTVLSLCAFMLLFGGSVYRSSLDWVPPERRPHLRMLADRIMDTVGGYVLGTVFISFLGGVAVALTMLVTGVPYFLPVGLAVAVLGLLPFLGSFVGVVMLFITTATTKDVKTAIICVAVYMTYLQVKNKLVAPLVQRHTIDMNPVLIAIVLLMGTALFGVLGTVIALPIAGAFQVVLRDLKQHRQEAWRRRDAERARAHPDQLELLPPDQVEEPPLPH